MSGIKIAMQLFRQQAGPVCSVDLVKFSGLSMTQCRKLLYDLVEREEIHYVGKAKQYQRADVKEETRMYSMNPETVPPTPVVIGTKLIKVKYKGVKAPKHYSEWRTPEMTVESYNLYEGRNLAMLAR